MTVHDPPAFAASSWLRDDRAVSDASLKGRLLVATPSLGDPNFDRTVVLVLEHQDDDGALGVVLNRPSEMDLDGPMPEWSRYAADPPVSSTFCPSKWERSR